MSPWGRPIFKGSFRTAGSRSHTTGVFLGTPQCAAAPRATANETELWLDCGLCHITQFCTALGLTAKTREALRPRGSSRPGLKRKLTGEAHVRSKQPSSGGESCARKQLIGRAAYTCTCTTLGGAELKSFAFVELDVAGLGRGRGNARQPRRWL